MKKYYYQGSNPQGTQSEGWVHADSLSDAASKLHNLGVMASQIRLAQENRTVQDLLFSMFPKWQIKAVDLILLFGQLELLSQSGVSILAALQSIQDSSENVRLKHILHDIVMHVEFGHTLSEAMRLYPSLFNTFIVSLVSIGERTGNMDFAFRQIKHYLEEDLKSKRHLRMALRYPIFVIATVLVAMIVINFIVMPSFIEFFQAFSSDLPWATRILVALSHFFLNYGDLILIMIVMSSVLGMVFLKTQAGKLYYGRQKLKIPFVGKLIEYTLISQFCSQLSHALQANVQILTALQVITFVSSNEYFRTQLRSLRRKIETGESLSKAMSTCWLFSPLLLQMVRVGEQTGKVELALDQISKFYAQEVEYGLKNISEKIEPILIFIISLMVLVLALGVFLPMWDISTVALRNINP